MLSLNIVLTLCFLFRFITIIIFFTSPLNEFAPDAAKRGFYRAANSIFWPGGGIGRIASEEVVLRLIITGALRVVVNGWMDGWITPPIAF